MVGHQEHPLICIEHPYVTNQTIIECLKGRMRKYEHTTGSGEAPDTFVASQMQDCCCEWLD